jgi:hypothetical protein
VNVLFYAVALKMSQLDQILSRNESFFSRLQIALDGVIQTGRMECCCTADRRRSGGSCSTGVLVFFIIVGLLICCDFSALTTWERIASRWRPAFSSLLITTAVAAQSARLISSCVMIEFGMGALIHRLAELLGRSMRVKPSP